MGLEADRCHGQWSAKSRHRPVTDPGWLSTEEASRRLLWLAARDGWRLEACDLAARIRSRGGQLPSAIAGRARIAAIRLPPGAGDRQVACRAFLVNADRFRWVADHPALDAGRGLAGIDYAVKSGWVAGGISR